MLESFHVVVDAVIILGLSVSVSLLLLWVVRSLVPAERLRPHNEVSGFVYAVIGVIYAVILGFVVITVWEGFQDAETTARLEATAVRDLYRISEGLPEPSGQEMQEALVAYASAVISEEWPAMTDGVTSGAQSMDEIDGLWAVIYDIEATTPAEEGLYASALEQLLSLSNHRRERLEDAESGLLVMMWAVMIGGAVLTVLFPCLFGVENGLVHSLIIATLAASIGLLLFVVYDLDRPYEGDMYVRPDGMTLVLEQLVGDDQAFLEAAHR